MTKQKLAIAIKSCHKYAARREAQLETWLKDVDCDFFFLVGDPAPAGNDFLYCQGASDEFRNIAPKVLTACEYALSEGVTNLLICDDDSYIRWRAMMRSGFEKHHYVGHMRTDDIDYNQGIPYAQGHAFWLSEYAMRHVVNNRAVMTDGVIDDGAVGKALDGWVPLTHDRRYWSGPTPTIEAGLVSIHKCTSGDMYVLHSSDARLS